MTAARIPAGNISWIDLNTSDIEGAKEFYGALFSWEFEDMGAESYHYHQIRLGGKRVGGLGPAMGEGAPSAWSTYVATDDVAATAETIARNGGTVVAEPFEVFDQGRMAVFQDNQGAFISVWEPITHDGFEVSGVEGSHIWSELMADDVDAAQNFYGAVFGWTADPSPLNPAYRVFKNGDQEVGGLFQNPEGVRMPCYWGTAFGSDDVAATAARAEELGATVSMPVTDIAPGMQVAVLQDPQGAFFSLLTTVQGAQGSVADEQAGE